MGSTGAGAAAGGAGPDSPASALPSFASRAGAPDASAGKRAAPGRSAVAWGANAGGAMRSTASGGSSDRGGRASALAGSGAEGARPAASANAGEAGLAGAAAGRGQSQTATAAAETAANSRAKPTGRLLRSDTNINGADAGAGAWVSSWGASDNGGGTCPRRSRSPNIVFRTLIRPVQIAASGGATAAARAARLYAPAACPSQRRGPGAA
jgi:hypothetical protein